MSDIINSRTLSNKSRVYFFGALILAVLFSWSIAQWEAGSGASHNVLLIIGLTLLFWPWLLLGRPEIIEWLQEDVGLFANREFAWSVIPLLGIFLCGLSVGRVEFPAFATLVIAILFAIFLLNNYGVGHQGLTLADLFILALLWVPFDDRWTYFIWPGPDKLNYSGPSVLLVVVTVYLFVVLRRLADVKYNLIPTWKDIKIGIIAMAVFAVIIIPIGLATHFLRFPPSQPVRVVAVLLSFVGIFLTVAVPEELIFRGILQNGLGKDFLRMTKLDAQTAQWTALLVASIIFGLFHWNNGHNPLYVIFASVAGLFYGWAYIKGDSLWAPALAHTLVDLIWAFAFK